jgi:hypothetical protein
MFRPERAIGCQIVNFLKMVKGITQLDKGLQITFDSMEDADIAYRMIDQTDLEVVQRGFNIYVWYGDENV